MVRLSKAVLCLILWLGLGSSSALAQDEDSERELGWTNTTDLSLVITQGNSAANTLGFANRLRHTWEDARFQLDVKGVRSDTSGDRFFLADPGFEFPVGAQPEDLTFTFKATLRPTPSALPIGFATPGRTPGFNSTSRECGRIPHAVADTRRCQLSGRRSI